ncbi:ATP-binding protein [Streptomyces xinghaiensis]|uniref:ATP-binding protein n=1 Tax=Streptomyces xinghaiensis TaxID=1038928 RepID=UPI00342A6415
MSVHRRTFPGRPEEIRNARRFTVQCLGDPATAAPAELVVSELATNAVRHTASGAPAGTFQVVLDRTGPAVTVSVTDAGTTDTKPEFHHPDAEALCGRGLGIVAALAERVEVYGDHRGRTITVALPMPRPGGAAADDS